MKKRHVFSTPSLDVARQVYRAAREQGIGSDCILLEARKDIEIHRIRDDRKNVGMDFLPAAMRGTLLGAIAGLAAGLITMNIPFFGVSLLGAFGLMIVGALVGTWASALIGSALPDEVRRTFAGEIEAGKILVVVEAEPESFDLAEAAMVRAGGTLLPYEATAALT